MWFQRVARGRPFQFVESSQHNEGGRISCVCPAVSGRKRSSTSGFSSRARGLIANCLLPSPLPELPEPGLHPRHAECDGLCWIVLSLQEHSKSGDYVVQLAPGRLGSAQAASSTIIHKIGAESYGEAPIARQIQNVTYHEYPGTCSSDYKPGCL